MTELRDAGYTEEFTDVAGGVARYLAWLDQ